MPRLAPILAAALVAALPALPARAEPPSPVQTAALSARLYDAGVAAADPVLILAAARLRKGLNPVPAEGRAAEGGTAGGEEPLGWAEMAAAAEALAVEDEAVRALVADLRAEGTKGVITGPVYNIATLAAGDRDRYGRIDFRGGEYAEVYVEARQTVDLNLSVTDAQGRLVCADTDRSHIAYCGWRPDATGAFTLTVENRGGSATGYALMTN
jgi:hypothetical protein